MHTTTAAEWASAGFVGLSAISLIGLALAFADADLAYFDPRPAVRRALVSPAVCWLLNEVSKAHADCREMTAEAVLFARLSLREAALTAAALLALLTITPGATR